MSTKSPTNSTEISDAEPMSLRALRAELDRIDDALHDLLIERSHVVSKVGTEGRKAHTPYRPGREAAILRRLLGRHSGPLDPQGVVRIWRELVAAGSAVQGGHRISICDPDPGCSYVQLAREHFGALVPLRVHRDSAAALVDVLSGAAGIAVLPLPSESGTAGGAWWADLLDERWRGGVQHGPRLHIVARLPFWSPRTEGAPDAQALAVSRAEPDPSGEDRSIIGFSLDGEASRAGVNELVANAGLATRSVLLHRAGAETAALVEVEGFLTDSDARLEKFESMPGRYAVLGAYAVPAGEAAL